MYESERTRKDGRGAAGGLPWSHLSSLCCGLCCASFAILLLFAIWPAAAWSWQSFEESQCEIVETGIAYRGCVAQYDETDNIIAPALPGGRAGLHKYRQCTMDGGLPQRKGSLWTRGECTIKGNEEWTSVTGQRWSPVQNPVQKQETATYSELVESPNNSTSNAVFGRRLGVSDTFCTPKYLAWALVSHINNLPLKTRCAYRYGAEAGSFDTFSGAVASLSNLPACGERHTCHVMASDSDQKCVVAFESVGFFSLLWNSIANTFSPASGWFVFLAANLFILSVVILLFLCICLRTQESNQEYTRVMPREVHLEPEEVVRTLIGERQNAGGTSFNVLEMTVDDNIEYVVTASTGLNILPILGIEPCHGYGKPGYSELLSRCRADIRAESTKIVKAGRHVIHYATYKWTDMKYVYLKTIYQVERSKIIFVKIEATWFEQEY